MPKRFSATRALKQMICGRCQSSVKLSFDRYCEDCAQDIEIRKERPELTTAGNWRLRSAESKAKSYNAKRRKTLMKQLCCLNLKIDFLCKQANQAPLNNALNKTVSKLLDKQNKISDAYYKLEEALSGTSQHPQEKTKYDEKQIAINHLQALQRYARKLAQQECTN